MTASTARHTRRSARQPATLWRVPVVRVQRLAPAMVRVTAFGPQLAGFAGSGTDQHVKLYLYEPGTLLPEPLTVQSARAAWSASGRRVRPAMRSYTIRRHDADACEIDIDFVLHDKPGPASEWARRARPGDELIFVGPSPAYLPSPQASRYLLCGDSSALPAIEAIARELPAGADASVLVELSDTAERRELSSPADVDVTWLAPGLLPRAVAHLSLPVGLTDAWVAGESATVLALRDHLLTERGIARERVRPTKYWRVGRASN